MNLLYISYWGIEEGLTQATVIPHIKILSHYDATKKIILVTVERGGKSGTQFISDKTVHIPIRAGTFSWPYIAQVIDFIKIPFILKRYCVKYNIDKIIARGSLAGTLAYKVFKKTNIPFYVESFEPHADYMGDTGVWYKWGLKYVLQKRWEIKQSLHASGLMTVTEGYADYLKARYKNGIRILIVPCATDTHHFKYDPEDRRRIRKSLGFGENQTVGIYAGKFGGLYLNLNELAIIKELSRHFPGLGLILLTPTAEGIILKEIKRFNHSDVKIIVRNVPHQAVSQYLSAADFALSLNKSFPSGKYLSPVKIGEYWANGLPVLMTEGIGDEHEFLEAEKGGVLFNLKNLSLVLKKLDEIIGDPGHRDRIPDLARKYRSFNTVKEAYQNLLFTPN